MSAAVDAQRLDTPLTTNPIDFGTEIAHSVTDCDYFDYTKDTTKYIHIHTH